MVVVAPSRADDWRDVDCLKGWNAVNTEIFGIGGKVDRLKHAALVADWRNVIFIHYAIAPAVLQPFVPAELDLFDGEAYVSLVAFTQTRLRPGIGGKFSEWLTQPLAEHEFLNLRTYVRIGEERGIYFLSEWIPHRLAQLLGPLTYGLPYRLARRMRYQNEPNGGQVCGRVECANAFAYRATIDPTTVPRTAEPGSLEAFLVERYHAWTYCNGLTRRFRVTHDPWQFRDVEAVVEDDSLLRGIAPWFGTAEFRSAHQSSGVSNVGIGLPGVARWGAVLRSARGLRGARVFDGREERGYRDRKERRTNPIGENDAQERLPI